MARPESLKYMKDVMNRFNTPNNLLVITSYPNPKNSKYGKRDLNAVAWHSEKTLKELARDRKIIVLAEKAHDEDESFYAGQNIYINRVWKKTNPLSILALAWEALKLNYIKTVFVPFEFNVFGGTIHNLLFLIVLLLLKLNGKNVVIEVHQVIEDIKELQKHINITSPLAHRFYNFGLSLYYSLFGFLATKIVVFEEELKIRLQKHVPVEKIETLSLSVEKKKTINKNYARKKLGLPKKDFLVMVFGYINGYKGIDVITDAFSHIKNRTIKLIIAGGKNPYLRDKKFYQKFYRNIVKHAKNNKKIILTGFVPDEKVGLYFAAADLITLPYEVFMSASGPFSLALSYGKATILSEKLSAYQESPDFKEVQKHVGLENEEIFFNLKKDSLLNLVKKAKKSKLLYKKLGSFSKGLAEKRSSTGVIQKYKEILFPDINLAFGKVKGKRLKLIYN